MPDPAHPSAERLHAFTQGRIGDAELAAIAAHLDTCAGCCSLLDTLAPADPLVDCLQTAARGHEPAELARDRRRAVRALLLGEPAETPRLTGDSVAAVPGPPPLVQGYRVLEEVARGGMGVVYRAEHLALKRPAALKLILAGRLASPAQVARFRREAELAARLHHPNIVRVYEVGEHDGLPFLALEWVDGGSLAARLAGTPLSPHAAARLVETLARAVGHAHAAGVIHRDLKPGNVLLRRRHPAPETTAPDPATAADDEPLVADFGLARLLDGDLSLTQTGTAAGTPSYMAPEQAAGTEAIGPLADVYALGALLYEMLTGRPPFQGASAVDTLHMVRHQEPVPPRRLNHAVPRDLDTVALKCLDKDPARRYATAGALADDLARFSRGEPIVARPVGLPARAGKWARRNPALAALLVLTLLTLAGGVAVSTYFAVESGRRAADALLARHQSDRHAAQLLFREGAAQCESGAVPRGLATLLDAWQAAPEDDADFRRVVRTNLAAWRWHLPRLRGICSHPANTPFRPVAQDDGRTFITWSSRGVQLWDAVTVAPVGPPVHARPGEYIHSAFSDGVMLCRGDGRWYFRTFTDASAPDQPLPDWAHPLDDVLIERRGPNGPHALFKGPEGGKDQPLHAWLLLPDKPQPVRLPPGGGLSVRIAADRAGRDVLVAFRHESPSGTDELELWDLATAQKASGFEPRPGGGDPAVTWDGQRLLTVSTVRAFNFFGPAGHDGSVRWWDPRTGRLAGPAWQPHRAAWFTELGGDHATLAAWCRDWRLRLYDRDTGLQRGGDLLLNLDSSDAAWTRTFSLAPDGGTLFAGDRHREVHVWDVRHLHLQVSAASSPRLPLARPTAAAAFGHHAAFSPDAAVALVCPRTLADFAVLLDAAGRPRGPPLSHRLAFYPVFSADSRLAATISNNVAHGGDEVACLWNAATGEPHGPPLRNPRFLHCAAFSPDARWLALGGTGGVHLWDAATAALVRPLPEKSTACCLCFSPDGGRLAVGCRGGWPGVGPGVRLWDTATGQAVGDFVATGLEVTQLVFTDGGQTLLALAANRKLWSLDAASGRPHGEPRLLASGRAAVFSPDGSRVAAADPGGAVRQWDARTAAPLGSPLSHPTRVVSLHYAPAGDLLASVCEDESVRLWDAGTGLPLGPPLVHHSAVLAAAFTPDGRSLRTVTAAGGVHTWPVPLPVADDPDRFALWLAAFAGLRRQGDEVVLLSAGPWREAVADFAARHPDPDPALAVPDDESAWHETRAVEAEEHGSTAAALVHLDRLATLHPDAWIYPARRGRALAQAADLAPAAAAYARAEALDPAATRDWYRHRLAALANQPLHDAMRKWYMERLSGVQAAPP